MSTESMSVPAAAKIIVDKLGAAKGEFVFSNTSIDLIKVRSWLNKSRPRILMVGVSNEVHEAIRTILQQDLFSNNNLYLGDTDYVSVVKMDASSISSGEEVPLRIGLDFVKVTVKYGMETVFFHAVVGRREDRFAKRDTNPVVPKTDALALLKTIRSYNEEDSGSKSRPNKKGGGHKHKSGSPKRQRFN